jgi:hypothetical protein
MNGIVVGGGNDNGNTNRSAVTLYVFSSWQNPNGGAAGYELPHVLVPADGLWTVPAQEGGIARTVSGTSFAAPQVAGIVASLQEKHANLKFWSSASLALLMVGADVSTTAPTWLSLSDGVDDKDGAGLVNAQLSRRACDKANGGQVAQVSAFDYGTFFESSTPAGSTYSEVWNARVQPHSALRVAMKLNAVNSCTSGDPESCTVQNFPRTTLRIISGSGLVMASSANINSTYQYAVVSNFSGVAFDYGITVRIDSWDGLTFTDFGIAWSGE